MYWRAKSSTNEKFIKQLKEYDVIKKDETFNAMMAVDRGHYCTKGDPYVDSPQSIGYGVTISAPHMHATALDLFNSIILAKKGDVKVLDVGSGSGYLCACFAHMCCDKGGKVYGIDIIQELVKQSLKNIENDEKCVSWMKEGKLTIKHGDGWEGFKDDGPFDIIHVGAAAKTIPQALVKQIAKGGKMVIPVGDWSQHLMSVERDMEGKVTKKKIFGVRYVPLVNPKKLD